MTARRWILSLLAGAGVFALVFVGMSPVLPQGIASGLIALAAGVLVTGLVARARSVSQWALAAVLLVVLVLSVSAALVLVFLGGFA